MELTASGIDVAAAKNVALETMMGICRQELRTEPGDGSFKLAAQNSIPKTAEVSVVHLSLHCSH